MNYRVEKVMLLHLNELLDEISRGKLHAYINALVNETCVGVYYCIVSVDNK